MSLWFMSDITEWDGSFQDGSKEKERRTIKLSESNRSKRQVAIAVEAEIDLRCSFLVQRSKQVTVEHPIDIYALFFVLKR